MRFNNSAGRGWVFLLLLAGCSGPIVPVSGKVTMDGDPLADGTIVFRQPSSTADTEPYRAEIKGGSFEAKIPAGKYRVEIVAVREVPGKTDSFGNPQKESFIPKRYNSESKLEAEVVPDSPNELQFALYTETKTPVTPVGTGKKKKTKR